MIKLLTKLFAVAALSIHFSHAQAEAPQIVKDAEGHELVVVKAGEFMMGGTESAQDTVSAFPEANVLPTALADEYPRHRVRITKPFMLSRYEVTVGQFRHFADASGYQTEAETDGKGGWGYNLDSKKSEGRRPHFSWRNPGYPQTERHPVVNVSYNDALAYLHWLSAKEGKPYRLPTEAEWEYANRAGSNSRYSGTNDPSGLPKIARAIDMSRHSAFGHVQDLLIEADDPTAFPAPVGSYAPNAWGFFDMHGNAWEWVSDWYGENYYAASPVDDPQGASNGDVRVRRGGGWNSFPIWLRSSFRNINTPGSRCLNLGFRVARDM